MSTAGGVIRLFDSIVKRYPVGSLLLWRRPAPAQRVPLGRLSIDAPAVDHALWVVDGQQRITSLANALHDDGATDPRFALAYDFRAGRIVNRDREPVHIEDLAQVRNIYPADKYTGNYEMVAALVYRRHDLSALREFTPATCTIAHSRTLLS